jgi:RNA polymerase sigma factor (sigma-70 family)
MAEHSIAESQQLLAIKHNDEATLKQFYLNNYPKVEKFVLNNNGSSEQARDIFQEAFIAAWRNIQLDRFIAHNESALDAYIFRIAKNKWMDHLRSGHYNKTVRMNDNLNVVEDEAEIDESEQQYLEALKKEFKNLGDNCRKILTLFYYHNHSLKKIAHSMGWTEATAKNNKYRCIQKLKELVNQKP